MVNTLWSLHIPQVLWFTSIIQGRAYPGEGMDDLAMMLEVTYQDNSLNGALSLQRDILLNPAVLQRVQFGSKWSNNPLSCFKFGILCVNETMPLCKIFHFHEAAGKLLHETKSLVSRL